MVHLGTYKTAYTNINGLIFIDMKTTTLILTYQQADRLLNNLPKGHQVKVSVQNLNKIIDMAKKAGK